MSPGPLCLVFVAVLTGIHTSSAALVEIYVGIQFGTYWGPSAVLDADLTGDGIADVRLNVERESIDEPGYFLDSATVDLTNLDDLALGFAFARFERFGPDSSSSPTNRSIGVTNSVVNLDLPGHQFYTGGVPLVFSDPSQYGTNISGFLEVTAELRFSIIEITVNRLVWDEADPSRSLQIQDIEGQVFNAPTIIPEPSHATFAMLGVLGLLTRRRRHRDGPRTD